jgi:uncharacterized protein (TIGR02246 family)
MRHTLLMMILSVVCSIGYTQNTRAQKAVEAQIDAFIASWNKHNFSDMKNYVAEDCDFINIVGMHWKGREDIQYAHQTYHNQFFKNTPMEKQSVAIRFLKPDIAIAHLNWHIGAYNAPDSSIRGNNDDLATFVFVKRNGKWLLIAAENVEISGQAQPFDPVKIRQQLKQNNKIDKRLQ